ncbi:MAG TPA: AbrB/MazE/SpoVT family DNA-binding domain-containing protein [Terriglobales bacterium]
MTSRISSKGQITVPAQVRRALGLRAGTPVAFELRSGGVLLRKRAPAAGSDPVDRLYGVLRGLPPVDQIIEQLRGPGPVPKRRR